jgi:hypothetical protein
VLLVQGMLSCNAGYHCCILTGYVFSSLIFQNIEDVLDVSERISSERLAVVSNVDTVNSILSHSPVLALLEPTCI